MRAIPRTPIGGSLSRPEIIAVSAVSADVNSSTAENTIPITPDDGMVVLAHVVSSATVGDPSITPPAGQGFALVTSGYDSTGTDSKAALYWKRWGDGDVNSLDVDFVFSSGSAHSTLLVLSRCATGTPYDAAASLVGSSLAQTTMLIAPSVDVPFQGLLIRFYTASATAETLTTDIGTPAYEGASYAWTAGLDGAMAATADITTPGFSMSGTATASVAPNNGWCTLALGLAGDGIDPVVAAISAISANTNSTSATNTVPGTPVTGNVILAHIPLVGAPVGLTPPAGEGWFLIGQIETQSGSNLLQAVYWKRWGDGFTDNTIVTFTSTSGNMRLVLWTIENCVTGTDPFTPSSVAQQCDDAANDLACTTPSVIVTVPRSAVLRFYACSATSPIFLMPPMSAKYGDSGYSWVNGPDGAMAASVLYPRTAGSAPLRSASTTFQTNGGWVGLTASFPPA